MSKSIFLPEGFTPLENPHWNGFTKGAMLATKKRKLQFIYSPAVRADDVLIVPAVIEGVRVGDRVACVERIIVNGIVINDDEYELFDGTQTVASATLLKHFPEWTETHILNDTPYVVLSVAHRPTFVLNNSVEAEIVFRLDA